MIQFAKFDSMKPLILAKTAILYVKFAKKPEIDISPSTGRRWLKERDHLEDQAYYYYYSYCSSYL